MLIESTWGWSGLVCCRRIGTDSSREPGQGQSVKTGTCPGGWVAVAAWHATGGGTQPHERDELIPTTTRDLSGASAAPFPRVGQELRRGRIGESSVPWSIVTPVVAWAMFSHPLRIAHGPVWP